MAAEKGTQLRSRLARVLNVPPEGTPPALASPAALLADLFEQPDRQSSFLTYLGNQHLKSFSTLFKVI